MKWELCAPYPPDPKAEPCVAVNALGGGYSLDDLKKAAGDNENQPPIVGDRTVSGLGNLPGFDLMADGELAIGVVFSLPAIDLRRQRDSRRDRHSLQLAGQDALPDDRCHVSRRPAGFGPENLSKSTGAGPGAERREGRQAKRRGAVRLARTPHQNSAVLHPAWCFLCRGARDPDDIRNAPVRSDSRPRVSSRLCASAPLPGPALTRLCPSCASR